MIVGHFEKSIFGTHSNQCVIDTQHKIFTVLKFAHVELERERREGGREKEPRVCV